MTAEIVTPLGKVFEGEIKEAYFPGIEGEFGVLENHAPLVTSLAPGVITLIKPDGKKEIIAIDKGYVEVTPNKVNVLISTAVPVSGPDESEIAKKLEEAKKLLRDAISSDTLYANVEAKIESAIR
ncbi:F-type H+-transporting ATPase subunit epsilon [Lebetimonas natsushimae]|uniref:ATP synthase epsilon chain n=1 Tax=Lebetimonas natsushimae TaxID=1936991 RepID=A0A292YEU4_9BACT|nr:ATP synthase F1 subunit epsilon [Lebetimonas natsushimae]GAX87816.1 F-type H+-transporting ATPase subunit epsilon [Lebetimonas natsushimae]